MDTITNQVSTTILPHPCHIPVATVFTIAEMTMQIEKCSVMHLSLSLSLSLFPLPPPPLSPTLAIVSQGGEANMNRKETDTATVSHNIQMTITTHAYRNIASRI